MAQTPPEAPNFKAKVSAVRDLPLTEDDPRFLPDQMVECSACLRSNPPNRTSCLYCGKALDAASVRSVIARISYQRPESWEDGFSLVYSAKTEASRKAIASASSSLQIDQEALERLLSVGAPVPLIYLRSLPDAGLLGSRLSQAGFDCAVVGDDLLQAKVLPTRLRSIVFVDGTVLLKDFNTIKSQAIETGERVLIVVGSLVKTSAEISGKLRKRAMKTTNESLAYSDETVIDIYPRSDVYGFRVRASGFDFSCLGEKMQQLASSNMAELLGELRHRFSSAVFVDAFRSAAPMIGDIWPLTEIKQSSEIKRGTFGGVRKQTITVLDNTDQFTKFSRLQRHFI